MTCVHITANSRLTQRLKQALTEFTNGVGYTPQVQTLGQWWQAWHEQALLMGELPSSLAPKLSSFEAQLIWQDLLAKASDEQAELTLLNPKDTAKQAHQAWLFLVEYCQESDFTDRYLNAETRLWMRLTQGYQAYLAQHELTDEALWMQQQLELLAQGVGRLPSEFVLHGFDDLSPNIQRWRAIVENRGVQVRIAQMPALAATSQLFVAQAPQQEVQMVAHWAVQQWQALAKHKPLADIRIGLVAPNLSEVLFDLKWALDEQLLLAGLSEYGAQQPRYNVSLGQPLNQVPVVQNALQTLQLLLIPQKTVHYADWSAWLLSPYTLGDYVARHALDAQLRKKQWATFRWPTLLQQAGEEFVGLANLKKALLSWETTAQKIPKTLSFADFIQTVQQLLTQLHWGQRQAFGALQSIEFQQVSAFLETLSQAALLKTPKAKQSPQAWLAVLQGYVSEQVHQPQSTQIQPIQVLGMLEASGQTFDALWVMGLTDQAWPRMPQPNAFMPFELQVEKAMPRADAQRELRYAVSLTQGFAQAAPQVVWSYAQTLEGATRLPSPLLDSEVMFGADALPLLPFESGQNYQGLASLSYQQKSPAQWVEDAMAPPVPLGQKAPGGTGILAAQNACPLMAFMDYRLGARADLQTVEEGMQSTQLGSLIHKVLEDFWEVLKTQTALLNLTDAQLTSQLESLIAEQMLPLASHFEAQYLALESQRILKLLLNWCDLEKQRTSFKVVANELSTELELSGIRFKVKVDRVDNINGDWLILDYKTGKASVNGLISERFDAPQLAIYLWTLAALAEKLQVAEAANVIGLGYGILHSDDGVKIDVLLDQEERLGDKKTKGFSLKVFEALSAKENHEFFGWQWSDFLEHLKAEVEKLARQVQQGHAAMVFGSELDIQYASSILALRVPEVKAQLGLFSDDEEGLEDEQ